MECSDIHDSRMEWRWEVWGDNVSELTTYVNVSFCVRSGAFLANFHK